ncbi:hypothetical protein [Bacillus thuringiensis]|uniref:hypothetical protein n=1 Tax=Bacillus thuringiensis TaxID=1428 RepID=UPI0015F316F5|nr:hypothetical protein [Bacillus thuringiensis]
MITVFTGFQDQLIALTDRKEFVMKMKPGLKMINDRFASFNGIVNHLIDKYYFNQDFM